jgi:hypothetical protein
LDCTLKCWGGAKKSRCKVLIYLYLYLSRDTEIDVQNWSRARIRHKRVVTEVSAMRNAGSFPVGPKLASSSGTYRIHRKMRIKS